MDPLEQQWDRYLCTDTLMQLHLTHSFARCAEEHQRPRRDLPQGGAAGQGLILRQRLPLSSSGHPPEPHCPPHASCDAREGPAAWPLTESPGRLQPTVFAFSVTLDAFTLTAASPALGEALLLAPAKVFEEQFQQAATRWLVARADEALHRPQGREAELLDVCVRNPTVGHSANCSFGAAALLRCPEEYVHALAARRLEVSISVLVLRIPHFFSHVWTETVPRRIDPDEVMQGEGGVAHLAGVWLGDSMTLDGISAIHAEEAPSPAPPRQMHRRASPRTTRNQPRRRRAILPDRRVMSLPSDTFVEAAGTSAVRLLGVVHEVFFAARASDTPLPWATLLVIPQGDDAIGGSCMTNAVLPAAGRSSSSVRKLVVDMTSVPPSVLRQALVVGQLVEVHGGLRVASNVVARDGLPFGATAAWSSAGATGAVSARALMVAEYLVATHVLLPFATGEGRCIGEGPCLPSQCTLSSGPWCPSADARRTVSMQQRGSGCMSTSDEETAATGGSDVLAHFLTECPDITGEGTLSRAAEEQCVRLALRCWEGVRMALGLDEELLRAPPTADAASEVPLLFCADFFSVSLDAVVAMLVTLMSPQAPGEDCSGVSLVLLDEGSPPLLSKLRQWLDVAAPSACVRFSPVVTSHARRSFFLPSYHEVTRRGSGATGAASPGRGGRRRWRSRSAGGGPVSGMSDPIRPREDPCAAAEEPPSGSAEAGTVPPMHGEVVRGGALSHAHRRTMLLQEAEAMMPDTIQALQHFLTSKEAIVAGLRDDSSRDGEDVDCPSVCPVAGVSPATQGEGGSLVVRRVGGQRVPYLATRSIIFTIRDGAQLLSKPALFELAQRADVVIRPALDPRRKVLAVCGCTEDGAVQRLLRERQAAWLGILGSALALPHTRCVVGGTGDPARVCGAQPPPHWLHAAPQLTPPCGRLLRSYFLAATAMCGEAIDANMMDTLVRLTCHHAQLRVRCTFQLYRAVAAARVAGTAAAMPGGEAAEEGQPKCSAEERDPPLTALVDAVVAVGLCDATLHFITGKTLLGECVVRMIAREVEADTAAASDEEANVTGPPSSALDADSRAATHFSFSAEDEVHQQNRFVRLVETSTRIEHIPGTGSHSQSFSIVDLVQDLEAHLASGINQCTRQTSP